MARGPVRAAALLEHDPEKCVAVFRKIMLDQKKSAGAMTR
jgi:hypothetical protein